MLALVSPLTMTHRRVTWSRPEGFVCLNVDGSLLGLNNTAGYGGLLRNIDGEFIWGFYGATAIQNILFAEIMAIWYGLKLCWECGFRKGNACADVLAKFGAISGSPLVNVSTPHRDLVWLGHSIDDARGVEFIKE
ncbi:ribonuclease H protein [Trifolium medium]|uniref:Ribonuclease H protein n=1 Tax=Trifolium medium TaxID=97028 RepID=A0A392PET4_9FABA|nr:ribonuclease H protein [Trifolium medium]